MKSNKQFYKQTILLIMLGSLLIGSTLLTKFFTDTHVDIDDFLKGLGVTFIISSLFVQKKLELKHLS